MNGEQIQVGRDALIELGWTNESMLAFANTLCERQVKKEIAQGILPYLLSVSNELRTVESEIGELVQHIEEYVGESQ